MKRRSGLADSPFFTSSSPKGKSSPRRQSSKVLASQAQAQTAKEVSPVAPTAPLDQPEERPEHNESTVEEIQTSNRDTTTPRNHDTMTPRYHDTIVELVRKAVKEIGKEAATHRFTAEEKKAVAGIIYAYRAQGLRTSENEIARVAINFIIHDYRENGENSVLGKVLKALHT